MQAIFRHFLIWNAWIYQLSHCLHLPFANSFVTHIFLIHKTFFLENSFVEKLVLASKFLKWCRNLFKAITYSHNDEVLLSETKLGVHIHGIIILKHTTQSCLKFILCLIIHGNANGNFHPLIFLYRKLPHSWYQTCILYFSWLSIPLKPTWTHYWISNCGGESHGLIRLMLGRLPLSLLLSHHPSAPITSTLNTSRNTWLHCLLQPSLTSLNLTLTLFHSLLAFCLNPLASLAPTHVTFTLRKITIGSSRCSSCIIWLNFSIWGVCQITIHIQYNIEQ